MRRREQTAEEPRRRLIERLHDDPLYFLSSKEAFLEGAEAFLYIKDKSNRIRPWTCNNTQHVITNGYFDCKLKGIPCRKVVLKGRQQGSSTGTGVIGEMNMKCQPGTNLLIATEEKQASGKNIYNMYRTFKENFPIQYSVRREVDNELIEYGRDLNNGLLRVSGERKVTSFTYSFIHLSEAAKFQDLDEFMDEMLQTVPPHELGTAVFVESTAEAYGDAYHELWQMAEDERVDFGWDAIFIPWYVHEEYEFPFVTDEERREFEQSLGNDRNDRYGDEVALLKTEPYIIPTVNGEVREVGITLENLKWRRQQIAILKFSLPRFYRQYPTTAEEAFLTSSLNVLDRDALDWYTKERVHDPKTGELRGTEREGEFFEKDPLSKNTFSMIRQSTRLSTSSKMSDPTANTSSAWTWRKGWSPAISVARSSCRGCRSVWSHG